MNIGVYQFIFDHAVPLLDAEMSLHLAILAAEGLFGEAAVRMDVGYHVDEPHRLLIVDGTSQVGGTVVRMLTTFLLRQFGAESFEVRRMQCPLNSPVTYAGAA